MTEQETQVATTMMNFTRNQGSKNYNKMSLPIHQTGKN